jgi:hypothetical protein
MVFHPFSIDVPSIPHPFSIRFRNPFSISPSPSRQVLPVRKVGRLLPPQELKHLLQSAQSIAPGNGTEDAAAVGCWAG